MIATAKRRKPKPNGESVNIAKVCAELQALQRQRTIVLKSRNMQANRIQAIVAGTLGYESRMPEKERRKTFGEAAAVIKRIREGATDHPLCEIIRVTLIGIDAFIAKKTALEKQMLQWAKLLPVASWVSEPKQRGFGLLFLAIVIGETGDLANYPGPAKLWRRLGCAPWTFDGKTRMGATWKGGREGKLPALEWERFGYSPRRRSIAYLIGEAIVKQNGSIKGNKAEVNDRTSDAESASVDSGFDTGGGDESSLDTEYWRVSPASFCGPYRRSYDVAKIAFKSAHPDYSDLRCHRHGMLVATKMLLKALWCQWNRRGYVAGRCG